MRTTIDSLPPELVDVIVERLGAQTGPERNSSLVQVARLAPAFTEPAERQLNKTVFLANEQKMRNWLAGKTGSPRVIPVRSMSVGAFQHDSMDVGMVREVISHCHRMKRLCFLGTEQVLPPDLLSHSILSTLEHLHWACSAASKSANDFSVPFALKSMYSGGELPLRVPKSIAIASIASLSRLVIDLSSDMFIATETHAQQHLVFLSLVGSNLTHLAILARGLRYSVVVQGLEHCTRLQQLAYHVFAEGAAFPSAIPLAALQSTINSLPHTALASLILRIDAVATPQYDSLFSSANLANFKKVKFEAVAEKAVGKALVRRLREWGIEVVCADSGHRKRSSSSWFRLD